MKVVGIGLGKTGTKTLAACLRLMGFSHHTWDRSVYSAYKRLGADGVLDVLNGCDSVDDYPWPLVYRAVDLRFPGSKFILTTRIDADTWVRSVKISMERKSASTFWDVLGMRPGHFEPDVARDFYLRHLDEVRAYFAGRDDDLLEICWERGEGWDRLAPFLGRPAPAVPIPHVHRRKSEWGWRLARLRRRLRRLGHLSRP